MNIVLFCALMNSLNLLVVAGSATADWLGWVCQGGVQGMLCGLPKPVISPSLNCCKELMALQVRHQGLGKGAWMAVSLPCMRWSPLLGLWQL